ncbi:YbdK family carboxylate-amine ligase [Nocardia colli]|uniref:Putative glutamate--cysteine ligase 2 n=1 Tax=Nocardia colli TaxID=2545717 RepID=A0A5N0E0Y7_9NOCA|nr:glutamate--cysteine ligase [Nocardia colli]KAA8881885.1 YbdK family carboxylate-amine ligase [Nocardia colli]
MDAHYPTVGVEEEFLLTHPLTGRPVYKSFEVKERARVAGVDLQFELNKCQVEATTRIHTHIPDLLEELRETRRITAKCARDSNIRLLAAGLPPTGSYRFPIVETLRYTKIIEMLGPLAYDQGNCGCHIHVAIPDRETAVQVGNYLRPWLPTLLALTANSALYRGVDTGFASWRNILLRRWPVCGPPPFFDSVADYDTLVGTLISSGTILDAGMVMWDVRPSAKYPTVEVRVSDVPATAEETALLAALVRALVISALLSMDEGIPPPVISHTLLSAAYWKAARFGLEGDGLDPSTGLAVPTNVLLHRLIEYLGPILEETGDRAFVSDTVAAVRRHGNGAARQAAALRAGSDIAQIVAGLADTTVAGTAA